MNNILRNIGQGDVAVRRLSRADRLVMKREPWRDFLGNGTSQFGRGVEKAALSLGKGVERGPFEESAGGEGSAGSDGFRSACCS